MPPIIWAAMLAGDLHLQAITISFATPRQQLVIRLINTVLTNCYKPPRSFLTFFLDALHFLIKVIMRKRASFKKWLPAREVGANTSSGIASSPAEKTLWRAASDVLNKRYSCVYFSFVAANSGRKQEERGAWRSAFSVAVAVSERPFLKDGPVLLRFTGKHVGHPALFLLWASYQGLMRLSPRMFLLYLSRGQFGGPSAQIEPFCLTLKQTEGPLCVCPFLFIPPPPSSCCCPRWPRSQV